LQIVKHCPNVTNVSRQPRKQQVQQQELFFSIISQYFKSNRTRHSCRRYQ